MSLRSSFVAAGIIALAGCSATNPRVRTSLNADAAFKGGLPVDPLRWQIITSGVDPSRGTMFTLFGNDAAVRHARSSAGRGYPEGSALALATWQEQEHSRWVGARIPAQALSVEFVSVQAAADRMPSILYRVYEGSPLKETTNLNPQGNGAAYIFSLRAAVMP